MKLEETTSAVVDGVEVFPIPGWEERYGISKCGKVRCFGWTIETRGRAGSRVVKPLKPRWMKTGLVNPGYLKVRLSHPSGDGRSVYAYVHRLLAFTFLNCGPNDYVDHADADPTNNALTNIRVVTQSQNTGNSRLSKRNTSGYKGVSLEKKSGKWVAQLKSKHLGRFEKPEDAAHAYDRAAAEYYGLEYARINFPSEV